MPRIKKSVSPKRRASKPKPVKAKSELSPEEDDPMSVDEEDGDDDESPLLKRKSNSREQEGD